MTPCPITRAWALLLALSAASTAIALAVSQERIGGAAPPAAMPVAGAAILALAWAKARTILNSYLRLNEAPAFRRGAGLSLALYAALLLALYLAG